MATIAVFGTFDSKGHELAFVAELIRSQGHQTMTIDAGTFEPPLVPVDVSRETLIDFSTVSDKADRGACVIAMAQAAPKAVARLATEGKIDGIISLGGGGGTAIGTAVMRALPVGFPKLMVSTLASGNVAPYVGTTDIVMMPSLVDVSGLNRISRMVFTRAVGAICGMVEAKIDTSEARPVIAASMFGNTTGCVNAAREILENAGYEVLVFHATGTGGKTMEGLIESGMMAGVLDITTTEWADEVVGGVLSAGPRRLEAMAKAKVPAIVVPGCVDMVNFGEPATVPTAFAGRTFYHHNPQVTLMRTNAEECARIGQILAEKANASPAPVTVLLPKGGVSVISRPGQPFYSPEADEALFSSIKHHLRSDIPLVEMNCDINDPGFARACAETLLTLLAK